MSIFFQLKAWAGKNVFVWGYVIQNFAENFPKFESCASERNALVIS